MAESQISTQIIALLEHYKQKDPVGIPGNFIADPLPGKSTVKFQKKREENSFLFRFFFNMTDASPRFETIIANGINT